ncbi:DUF4479 and tRNA-binding domain-containing protein [Aerococcaceae bacterium NML130460]|nr:DUF4479 and tRNA-binding domain-containing protein [Aerococcaceae bacterium NML130460]
MWLAFYNREAVGDVLLLTRGLLDKVNVATVSKDNVTIICHKDTAEIMSVNLFGIGESLGLVGNGPIALNERQVEQVNNLVKVFDLTIQVDNSPKFVVGHVEQCVDHEDSDHLHITQTRVGEDEVLQIVCGAGNIAQGQQIIVAKPGAVMPSGAIIWDGELRGVASHGMICSTRELNLTEIEDKPGIWVLPQDFAAGTPLAEVVANLA